MPGIFDFLGSLFGGGGGSSGGSDLFGDLGGDTYSGDFGGGFTDLISGGGGGSGSPFGDLGSLFGGGSGGGGPINYTGLFGGAPIDSVSGGISGNLTNFGLPALNAFTSPGGGSPIDSITAGIAPNLAGIAAGGVSGLNNLISGAVPNGNLNSVGAGINDVLRVLGGGGNGAGGNGVAVPGATNGSGTLVPGGPPSGGGGGTPTNPANGILGTGLSLPQLLAGLGLGGSLLQGNKPLPGSDVLKGIADKNQQLVDNQLMPTALANQQGNINGQALSAIDRRLQESEAGLRSKYAAMGMSGSTMEQEDLAGLRANAQDQVFAEGQQMAATGLQTAAALTGQDTSIYEALMQAQVQQDEELSKAIAAFAGAASR